MKFDKKYNKLLGEASTVNSLAQAIYEGILDGIKAFSKLNIQVKGGTEYKTLSAKVTGPKITPEKAMYISKALRASGDDIEKYEKDEYVYSTDIEVRCEDINYIRGGSIDLDIWADGEYRLTTGSATGDLVADVSGDAVRGDNVAKEEVMELVIKSLRSLAKDLPVIEDKDSEEEDE